MNTSYRVRAACLLASTAVTFVLVYALAVVGYPEPVAPQLAQAAATTCMR